MTQTPHITVCICTFKRPELLTRLLEHLARQDTGGSFTYSIVVADNDCERSASNVVLEFTANSQLSVTYCVEREANIALARNLAVKNADGEFIAFIDDDEFPATDWLVSLFTAISTYKVNGVLGPVKPHFECEPPNWVRKGRFFDRPTHQSGYRLAWHESRTGNVLFERDILKDTDTVFRPIFATAGEDMDFFRRMMEQGCTFAWCDEAAVYESVPAARCTSSYLLKRALLRGSNFRKHPTDRLKNAFKSLIAVPSYLIILPFLALAGPHLFIKYLIKLCDHTARLLGLMGLPLVTERQT